MLVNNNAFKPAANGYQQLLEGFKHNPTFLFEYAKCLGKQQCFIEANSILQRAAKVSCDPIIYTVLGENYQKMGLYQKAEECFLYASHLLPGRIYPYYLLTMLYAEPGFLQLEKMEKMRQLVLLKKPKVKSKAIDEMRVKVSLITIEK